METNRFACNFNDVPVCQFRLNDLLTIQSHSTASVQVANENMRPNYEDDHMNACKSVTIENEIGVLPAADQDERLLY